MGRISYRIVKYGAHWYAQARKWSWFFSIPPAPFWRVISRRDLEPAIFRLSKIHTAFPSLYAHDTSEDAAETISRFIDKLEADREKKRTRIELILPVEIVRRGDREQCRDDQVQ